MKRSLSDYLKSHPMKRGLPCSVCVLPTDILKQVHESGIDGGVSRATIAAWLVEQGYEKMNRLRLENHFTSKHPETRFGYKRNAK